MTAVGWLPAPAEDLFGAEATAEESYEVLTVDVPPSNWLSALETARTTLSCTYFDWLSAVDEPGTGFRVSAHVVALSPVRRLLVRTTVPHEAPVLPSAVGVYAGAAWHERETHEMFGVVFEGHPALHHLLLPESFEGHPLRKDFVLASRVAKAWPGAKEPGESDHGGPKRRQMLPPGVPDPNEWGPLKGQLPPAPARPARAAGRPAAAGDRPAPAAGERPVRRSRTASEGSVSQAPGADAGTPKEAPATARPTARRSRSVSEGSASQRAESTETPAPEVTESAVGDAAVTPSAPSAPSAPAGPRRARSAAGGSASQRAQAPSASSTPSDASPSAPYRPSTAPRSSDAPWHHARPAFQEPDPKASPDATPEEQSSETQSSEEATRRMPEPDRSKPERPEPEDPCTPDNPPGGPR